MSPKQEKHDPPPPVPPVAASQHGTGTGELPTVGFREQREPVAVRVEPVAAEEPGAILPKVAERDPGWIRISGTCPCDPIRTDDFGPGDTMVERISHHEGCPTGLFRETRTREFCQGTGRKATTGDK